MLAKGPRPKGVRNLQTKPFGSYLSGDSANDILKEMEETVSKRWSLPALTDLPQWGAQHSQKLKPFPQKPASLPVAALAKSHCGG